MRSYKGKDEFRIYTKGGIKQSISYDNKLSWYNTDEGTVKVYELVLLEEIPEQVFLTMPKNRFWYFSIKDTDISGIIQAETVTEAYEMWGVFLERHYATMSFDETQIFYKELDVITRG